MIHIHVFFFFIYVLPYRAQAFSASTNKGQLVTVNLLEQTRDIYGLLIKAFYTEGNCFDGIARIAHNVVYMDLWSIKLIERLFLVSGNSLDELRLDKCIKGTIQRGQVGTKLFSLALQRGNRERGRGNREDFQ